MKEQTKKEQKLQWVRERLKPFTQAEVEMQSRYLQYKLDTHGLESLDTEDVDRIRLLMTLGQSFAIPE